MTIRLDHNHRLETRAREIAEAFGGHWARGKGMCRCPAHDDRTPSLGLRLGSSAILLHCFAGCSADAVLAAFAQAGVQPRNFFGEGAEKVTVAQIRAGPDANALRLWRESAPLRGTSAASYLASRATPTESPELRFHAKTPLGRRPNTRFPPALIAAVRTDEAIIAVQRTFLDKNGRRASFARPKRALGALGVGAVRLAAPQNGRLGLAEGIESALSATALTGVTCWATLGNERFGLVAIPDSVCELHLFLDDDAGGDLARDRAIAAYARDDRVIVEHRPVGGHSDWNDALRADVPQQAA